MSLTLNQRLKRWGAVTLLVGGTILSLVTACGPTQTPNRPDYPTNTPTPAAVYSPVPTDTLVPTETFTPTVTATATNTATPTSSPTPTETPTPTPIPEYDVVLGFFEDCNTDGVQNSCIDMDGVTHYDSPITGLEVCLDEVGSDFCGVTDGDGNVYFSGVPDGVHPVFALTEKFNTYNRSDEFVFFNKRLPSVRINDNVVLSYGLSEGPEHLPIKCEQMSQVLGVSNYFDLDPGPGVRDWEGGTHTYNGHNATADIILTGDVEIVASLPGVVDYIGPVKRIKDGEEVMYPKDYSVHVQTDTIDPWCPSCGPLRDQYIHLQVVLVREGQRVSEGDIIGLSIQSLFPIDDPETPIKEGYSKQHLHFMNTHNLNGRYNPFDLYKDLLDPDSHNYWSVFNTPVCF